MSQCHPSTLNPVLLSTVTMSSIIISVLLYNVTMSSINPESCPACHHPYFLSAVICHITLTLTPALLYAITRSALNCAIPYDVLFEMGLGLIWKILKPARCAARLVIMRHLPGQPSAMRTQCATLCGDDMTRARRHTCSMTLCNKHTGSIYQMFAILENLRF